MTLIRKPHPDIPVLLPQVTGAADACIGRLIVMSRRRRSKRGVRTALRRTPSQPASLSFPVAPENRSHHILCRSKIFGVGRPIAALPETPRKAVDPFREAWPGRDEMNQKSDEPSP